MHGPGPPRVPASPKRPTRGKPGPVYDATGLQESPNRRRAPTIPSLARSRAGCSWPTTAQGKQRRVREIVARSEEREAQQSEVCVEQDHADDDHV